MAASLTSPTNESSHGGFVAATWNALVLFAALAVLTLALLALAYFGKGPMRSVGFSTSAAPLQVVIGNDVFSIPENMFRHKRQRVEGVSSRVDLAVHWPSGEGYSELRLADFSSTAPDNNNTILISLSRRQSLLDMQARFQPALKRALVGHSVADAASGLLEAPLDPQFGFIDETLVYSKALAPGGDPLFVARCHAADAQKQLLHACELDRFVGVSGVARVRFSRTRLNDWRLFQTWLDENLAVLTMESG